MRGEVVADAMTTCRGSAFPSGSRHGGWTLGTRHPKHKRGAVKGALAYASGCHRLERLVIRRAAHAGAGFFELHDLFEALQVVDDLLIGVDAEELGEPGSHLSGGR